jgi:predicted transcriptional regulator
MQNAKHEVQELLKRISDDATFEDIQYQIFVRQKISRGEADVEAGRVLSQEEVERRMEKWLKS